MRSAKPHKILVGGLDTCGEHTVGSPADTDTGTQLSLAREHASRWSTSACDVRPVHDMRSHRPPRVRSQADRARKDEAVRATIMQKLIETGEKERCHMRARARAPFGAGGAGKPGSIGRARTVALGSV